MFLIGDRVKWTYDESEFVGTIAAIINNTYLIEWDDGVRTWHKEECIALLNDSDYEVDE